MPETTRVRLWGWNRDIQPGVRALLFGEMLARALPTVQHYRSDLYHDAVWLDRHVTGPTTFYWSVREWGTHLGTDRDLFLAAISGCDAEHAWRIELTCEAGEWFASFTELVLGRAWGGSGPIVELEDPTDVASAGGTSNAALESVAA